jgi:hypothetical protein
MFFLLNFSSKSSGVRPFGVSLLVGGIDRLKGPLLFQVDPSVRQYISLVIIHNYLLKRAPILPGMPQQSGRTILMQRPFWRNVIKKRMKRLMQSTQRC